MKRMGMWQYNIVMVLYTTTKPFFALNEQRMQQEKKYEYSAHSVNAIRIYIYTLTVYSVPTQPFLMPTLYKKNIKQNLQFLNCMPSI